MHSTTWLLAFISHGVPRSLKQALGFALAACLALFTTTAHAAEDGTGFEVGLRLGYAIPLGDASKTNSSPSKLSDSIYGAVPLILDLGYRVTPNVGLGLYGQYGFGILTDKVSSNCETGNADCSVSSFRAGLQASYIIALNILDAWFGLTLGMERLNLSSRSSVAGAASADSLIVTLPEYGAQLGANFKLGRGFSLGPFASFSMGRYSWGNITFNGRPIHVHIKDENRALHEWLILGIRGNYLF